MASARSTTAQNAAILVAVALVLLFAYLWSSTGDNVSAPTTAPTPSSTSHQAPASPRGTTPNGDTTTTSRSARSTTTPQAHPDWTPLSELPPEAAKTWALITTDGPFPFDRDGVVFSNFERRLPIKSRSYYHEYTVVTPGERDRGARRLIVGAEKDVWYTDDHYETFRRIDVEH